MSVGYGDRLARGANKASWGPLNVSKEKWASIWEPAEDEKSEALVSKSEPVAHVRVGIK